ncbi:sulfatase family protein [Persicirhabdus sediminis]|uniref:Sulfatase n=1 Tax=Persicirhabdus sediminis TaxID=454144 RepID=A0A8J7MDD9_9BACT|nr:sulfatase [Persicirhabdus sediminis]MBK1790438.1 sulfatase [Persicirhabdus sediminis]
MLKKLFLATAIAAPLATLHAEESRPNIIFIFSDDHAYQAISAYGSVINQTPNIDRIAEEGTIFEKCYVTNSICGPSRAVIQTGKHSHLNGYYRNGLVFDIDQQTFPKILQESGYETAIIGKWHLQCEVKGFDHSEVLIDQGPYYNPPMIRNGERVVHQGYTTDVITDLTMEWLKNERDADKPFMLMMQHKAPHRNWQPPLKYINRYDDVTIPEPETLFDDYSTRGSAAREQRMSIAETMNDIDLKLTYRNNLTPEQKEVWEKGYDEKNRQFREANLTGKDLVRWKYQRYIKDYIRCIDSIDDSVGVVLDYLEETGLDKNTIVIYSSDQGFYLGEHGWFDKRFMYEQSIRTPFIVKWPGVTEGTTNDKHIISNLDVAQTFLDIAGAEQPDDMQGASIVPVLKGEDPEDWRKSFYYHYYEYPGVHAVKRHYGVTTGRYKLINFYEINEIEFYDLEKDPHEINNLADNPEYAGKIAEMKKELARLQDHYGVIPDEEVEANNPLPVRKRRPQPQQKK